MKILVSGGYAPSLINFRGALLQVMSNVGHDVIACAAEDDCRVAEQLRSWGIRYQPVGVSRASLNPIADLLYLGRLCKLVKDFQPDIVLSYTHKSVIYTTLAARIARSQCRCFAIITGLGYAFVGSKGLKKQFANFAVRSLYKFCFRYFSGVFFQNPDDEKTFSRLGILPPSTPRQVIRGSGIDLDKFPASPINKQNRKFLLIARLLGDKGIREYAEAAKIIISAYPNTEFLLVGPMDPNPSAIGQGELKKWIDSGILKYQGWTDNVQKLYQNCFAYVLPSYREGTPRTVLEAMARSRPVITTDAPGCRETVFPFSNGYMRDGNILEGQNGFLVPVKSPNSVAKAMCRLLDDPILASKMGIEGRRLAESYYDVHKVNQQILSTMGVI